MPIACRGPEIEDPSVAKVFSLFPESAQEKLFEVRALIFEIGLELPQVGCVRETLRWGQPAYLTTKPRTGTTLRLGIPEPGWVGVYVHCQTTVIRDFEQRCPDVFRIEGNRGAHFPADIPVPEAALAHLIRSALLYHFNNRDPS